jgi:hypothetical protein
MITIQKEAISPNGSFEYSKTLKTNQFRVSARKKKRLDIRIDQIMALSFNLEFQKISHIRPKRWTGILHFHAGI